MPTPPISTETLLETLKVFNECAGNTCETAERLKLTRGGIQSRLRAAKARGLVPEVPEAGYNSKPKVLMLDIETAPHLVTSWGLFKQNIAINQIIKPGYTMCWAAKWHGKPEVMFDSILNDPKRMVRGIHALMDEADVIVHYNGNSFDVPTLHKEFLLQDMPPPAPSRHVDLLNTARKKFRLASNKLDFISQELGIGAKSEHKGHKLWLECMEHKKAAWKTMEQYNKNDVLLLEKLYDSLLPWISDNLNLSAFGNTFCCPRCGSWDYAQRKTVTLTTGIYRRYECNSCSGWFRINMREKHQRTKAIAI